MSTTWTPMPSFCSFEEDRAERLLARPRGCLVDLVLSEHRPQRILHLGDRSHDLDAVFPGAVVHSSAASGWPDLVWCDHLLAGADDPATRVAAVTRGLAPGTLVGAVEVHEAGASSVRTWLADELGLVPDRRVRRALDAALVCVQWSILPVDGRWLSLVYLGRTPGREPVRWRGPLNEEIDAG